MVHSRFDPETRQPNGGEPKTRIAELNTSNDFIIVSYHLKNNRKTNLFVKTFEGFVVSNNSQFCCFVSFLNDSMLAVTYKSTSHSSYVYLHLVIYQQF